MFICLRKFALILVLLIAVVGCGKHDSTQIPNATSDFHMMPGTPGNEGAPSPTVEIPGNKAQPSSTPAPQISPSSKPPSEELIVFYSERDGDAEIYIMKPDGSDQIPLTDNESDDLAPSWSPDGSLIVFESDRDDPNPKICFPNCDYNLYVMNADGSDQRRLTALPGTEWNPDWSPDGQSILFNASGLGFEKAGIYRMDLDGGEPQPLLVDDFNNAAPDWSPDGNQIAFSSNRDGNMDIFIMDAAGSTIRKIVDTTMDDYFPNWSPDGTQMTFFAADWPAVQQDIYTMDADGSNLQNITNTPYVVDEDPRWSPDGSKIIFQSDRDRNFEIYVMNPDGSQPQNLTQNRSPDYWPDWFMPHEKQIAFVSDHAGRAQIYLMPAPGAQTHEPIDIQDMQTLTDNQFENYYPSWSPDGKQIAYYTHFSSQSWAIMIMDADGSNSHQLTLSEGETICSFGPVWSPDGQKIAFTIEPNSQPTCEMKSTEIAVINIDGSGFNILTQNDSNDLAASWTPDGSQLVFTSDRDGQNQIYVMNADGSDPRRLTELDSTNSMPVLSPDGRFIAFVSNRSGNDEIYLMDADGSNPRRLTDNPASDWQPSWGPDGHQIVFTSGSMYTGFDLYMIRMDGTGLRQLTESPGWEFEPAWQPDCPSSGL
jgi:Tol biopolymer transport system component